MPVWGNVNPSTRIELYTGVPFDRNYTNVVRFTNEADQKGYFYSHLTGYYTGSFAPAYNSNTLNGRTGTILYNSYLNPDGSWIRERPRYTVKVNAVAEQLYKCNYMGWTNNPSQQELNPQNFDEDSTCPEQWYYAFITNIYHEANNVSVIEFELDYWQTYHLRITPLQCFVERESPESDEPFEHIAPEEVKGSGDYVLRRVGMRTYYQKYLVALCPASNAGTAPFTDFTTTNWADGQYSLVGLFYRPCTTQGVNEFFNKLNEIIQDGTGAEELISIYIACTNPEHGTISPETSNINPTGETIDSAVSVTTSFLGGTDVGGTGNVYKFRNNKMMCYPYRYFELGFNTGEKSQLKPELITTGTVQWTLYEFHTLHPFLAVVPNYQGLEKNFSEMVSYNEEIQTIWSKDTYNSYVAQNADSDLFKNMITAIAAAGGAAVSVASGNLIGAGMSLAGGAASILGSQAGYITASNAPNTYKGSQPTNSFPLTTGEYSVELWEYTLNVESAKQVDTYFQCYGYITNKAKVPNLTHGHWSYIKTSNFMCNSDGVSGNGLSAITDMFNNGVRIWNYRGTNGKDFDNNYFCKYSDAEGNLIDRQPEVVYN